MTMHDTNRNSRSLLTHLTLAGTAALAGSAANAQITVVPVNENIGFAPGDLSNFVSSLPGSKQFQFFRGSQVFVETKSGFAVHFEIGHVIDPYGASLQMRVDRFSTVAVAPAGKTFSQIGTRPRSSTMQGALVFSTSFAQRWPLFEEQYFAFKFQDATNSSQTDYGWIEASLTDRTYNGLNLDIIAYAYDTSGAKIKTGQTTSVPEPSPALALAAFGALTLGAAGVRRLKTLQH